MQFKKSINYLNKKFRRTHDRVAEEIILESMLAHQIIIILLGTKRRVSPHDIIVCKCEMQFTRAELADHQAKRVCQALLEEGYSAQRI